MRTISRANDNEPPSRPRYLVAVTIEDLVIPAEQDFEERRGVAAGPALVELAGQLLKSLSDFRSEWLARCGITHPGRRQRHMRSISIVRS